MGDVQVVQSPSGKWFADYKGWGRRFNTEEDAYKYAASFLIDDDTER